LNGQHKLIDVRKTDDELLQLVDELLQLVAAALTGGVISAAISVGLFVGTTRTRLNKLEEGLKDVKEKNIDDLKIDLKEYTQLNITAIKNDLDGKIKALEERIIGYKEKLDAQGHEVSELTKLFRNVGFEFFTRGIKKGDKNGLVIRRIHIQLLQQIL